MDSRSVPIPRVRLDGQWYLDQPFPVRHYRKTSTLVARLRMTWSIASMVLEGAIDGDRFEAYVGQVLIPELEPGGGVVMDRLSSYKGVSVSALIEATGARCMFRRAYRLDFNPIEKAFYRLKAVRRRVGERTVSSLWSLIGKLVDLIQRRNATITLAPAAMDQTDRKTS